MQQLMSLCMQAVAEIAVAEERWDEAAELLKQHADMAQAVALPWARWLTAQGRPGDAYAVYR
jgi:hypothetical protein